MEQDLKIKNYLAYGVGDFIGGGAQVVIGTLFLFFLTEVVGLRPILAGLAILAGRGWDAVTDPLIGYISDNTKSRFGRRRIFFLVGFIPAGITFAMMWLPVRFPLEHLVLAWYMLSYMLFSTFLTILWAPYTALNAEMTRDDKKRHWLTFVRMACSGTSGFASATIPKLIIDHYPGQEGYIIMGVIFGLFYSLPFIATFLGTFELPRPDREVSGRKKLSDVYRDWFSVFRNKSFRALLGMYICAFLAWDFVLALFIYFVTYYLLAGESFSLLMTGLYLGGVVLPLYVILGNKFGKGRAYLLAISLWATGLVVTMFFNPETPLAVLYLGPLFMGLGQGASTFLPWAILPSVTDVDEMMTTDRRAGVYAGTMTLFRKLVQAGALLLIASSLELIGYTPDVALQGQPVESLRWLWFLAPFSMLTLAFIFGFQFKITPQNHKVLMDEINRLIDGGSKTEVTAEAREVCELLSGKKYEELYHPGPVQKHIYKSGAGEGSGPKGFTGKY